MEMQVSGERKENGRPEQMDGRIQRAYDKKQ